MYIQIMIIPIYISFTIILDNDYRMKKVLFVGIRNRYCVVCERAKTLKLNPKIHICFLNWNQGATKY